MNWMFFIVGILAGWICCNILWGTRTIGMLLIDSEHDRWQFVFSEHMSDVRKYRRVLLKIKNDNTLSQDSQIL